MFNPWPCCRIDDPEPRIVHGQTASMVCVELCNKIYSSRVCTCNFIRHLYGFYSFRPSVCLSVSMFVCLRKKHRRKWVVISSCIASIITWNIWYNKAINTSQPLMRHQLLLFKRNNHVISVWNNLESEYTYK